MPEPTDREVILESRLAEANARIAELERRWDDAIGTNRWCPECRMEVSEDMRTHRHAILRTPWVYAVEPFGPPVMVRPDFTECPTVPRWVGTALLDYPDAARVFVANQEARRCEP